MKAPSPKQHEEATRGGGSAYDRGSVVSTVKVCPHGQRFYCRTCKIETGKHPKDAAID